MINLVDSVQEKKLSLTLNSCTDCVHILNAIIEVLACRVGLQTLATSRIILAVNELFANITQHGYGHDVGVIEFEGYVSNGEDDVQRIHLMFRDFAPVLHDVEKLKVSPCQNKEKLTPGGLGMHLIYCVMDSVQHEALEDGNRWQMIFDCGREEGGNEA